MASKPQAGSNLPPDLIAEIRRQERYVTLAEVLDLPRHAAIVGGHGHDLVAVAGAWAGDANGQVKLRNLLQAKYGNVSADCHARALMLLVTLGDG